MNGNELAKEQRGAASLQQRLLCPSRMELGEYHLALLETAHAVEVRRHLADCETCATELRRVQRYLKDTAPVIEAAAQTWPERVKTILAELLPPPAVGLAYAGVRGAEEPIHQYHAGDFYLNLEIRDDPEALGRKALLGLLTGPVGEGVAQLTRLAQPEVAQEAPVDDLGNFIFPALEVGEYTLSVRQGAWEIRVERVSVCP